MKKILFAALASLTFFGNIHAAGRESLLQKTEAKHIFVQNRVLAVVNGKPISVVDLMKKMDMVFYRQFPQYSAFPEARYQFYNLSWQSVLRELIEKELILADAQEVKVDINQGDVRQEIENLFGPNIIANLQKAELTYEEACKIVKEDLLIKRMMMMRVHSKAVREVTPQQIRAAYEDYAREHAVPSSWRYEIISINGKDEALCAKYSQEAYRLLAEEGIPANEVKARLSSSFPEDHSIQLNISEEYSGAVKDTSENYRIILSTLQKGSFSFPIAQKARSKETKLFRIFHLKDYIPGGAPPFSEAAVKIKASLIDKKIDEENKRYAERLYKHFHVQEEDYKDFNPFLLK